jgi:hypothetical protein
MIRAMPSAIARYVLIFIPISLRVFAVGITWDVLKDPCNAFGDCTLRVDIHPYLVACLCCGHYMGCAEGSVQCLWRLHATC